MCGASARVSTALVAPMVVDLDVLTEAEVEVVKAPSMSALISVLRITPAKPRAAGVRAARGPRHFHMGARVHGPFIKWSAGSRCADGLSDAPDISAGYLRTILDWAANSKSTIGSYLRLSESGRDEPSQRPAADVFSYATELSHFSE